MENEIAKRKSFARLTGLVDFIWIMTGIFAIFYIPSRINTTGDAATTAQNILSNEFLFRIGIVNGLISTALWVFLAMMFYRLLKSVNANQARLLVALVLVQVPTGFIMEAFNTTSLMLVKGEVLTTTDPGGRQNLALLFLRINDYITLTLELFWGLWLFPLGILVYRSLFLPRFLGVWLIIDGFALVVLAFTSLLFPQYKDTVYMIAFPAMLGEVAFMLWLLIMGANGSPVNSERRAPVSSANY